MSRPEQATPPPDAKEMTIAKALELKRKGDEDFAAGNCQNVFEYQLAKGYVLGYSSRDSQIERLVEAAKGYIGNGCEPTDGDIVHVPAHCRQCRLEEALKPFMREGGNPK